MKKSISMVLTCLVMGILTACSSESVEGTISEDVSVVVTEEKIAQSTEAETIAETEAVLFEEMIVVDNDECTIKITGIEPDDFWGYALKADFENKSSEKTYMYSVNSAAINGVQCDPFFATEVAAGKKAKENISFSDSALEEYGIEEITDIELVFRVYDSNDWMAEPVALESIHVYPMGEENATVFVREQSETDIVLFDNENITAIVTGTEVDDIWGYTLKFFFVNKTDSEVMFSVDEASINGYMADPFFAHSVMPNKCSFSSMSWSETTFEELDIETVEEIEFFMRAYHSDDWSADDLANDKFVLNP